MSTEKRCHICKMNEVEIKENVELGEGETPLSYVESFEYGKGGYICPFCFDFMNELIVSMGFVEERRVMDLIDEKLEKIGSLFSNVLWDIDEAIEEDKEDAEN